MPVLFISHYSKDDAAATSLEAWLRARGFSDIFVDHSSIGGGEEWAEALRGRRFHTAWRRPLPSSYALSIAYACFKAASLHRVKQCLIDKITDRSTVGVPR